MFKVELSAMIAASIALALFQCSRLGALGIGWANWPLWRWGTFPRNVGVLDLQS